MKKNNIVEKHEKEKKRIRLQWDDDIIYYKVYELASQEMTQREIAKNLGVATSTFCKMLIEKENIAEAYKKGQAAAPLRMKPVVEGVFLKTITGYEVMEKKRTTKKDSDGNVVFSTDEVHTKYIPPNVTAAIFYAKSKLGYDDGGKIGGDDNAKLEIIRKIVSSKNELKEFKEDKQE